MEAAKQIETFKELFDERYELELLEAISTDKGFIVIDFPKVAEYSPDLASDLLEDPENVIRTAFIAAQQIATKHQGTDRLFDIEVRFRELPTSSRIPVGTLRSKELRKLIQVRGIVRQKSDVRPQVVSSKFECPACGAIIPVLQVDMKFKEPTRCQCGRKGQFREISKQLVDAQKIVLEEASDELDGSEQPKRLNIILKKDLVSPLSDRRSNPGSKIEVVGYLTEVPVQLPQGQGRSTRYDIMMEGNWVEPVEEEFGQITISPEEIEKIKEMAADPQNYMKLVTSVAPSIYGHDKVKEALVLQLLGGVKKVRPDGVSTRGDMHVLLIGDPGSGKCVVGDTLVQLGDGSIQPIQQVFEEQRGMPKGTNAFEPNTTFTVASLEGHGQAQNETVTTVWQRIEEKPLLRITLNSGDVLTVTQDHPLFTANDGYAQAIPASEFCEGMPIMSARIVRPKTSIQTLPESVRSHAKKPVEINTPRVLDEELSRWLGYLCGDGWIQKRATGQPASMISFTNAEDDVLYDYRRIIERLFRIQPGERERVGSKEIYTTSSSLRSWIQTIAPELCVNAGEKRIPQIVMKSPLGVVAAFIQALFECDAHVTPNVRTVQYSTKNQVLAREVRMLLLRFGIRSQLFTKRKCATNTKQKTMRTYYEVHISGNDVNTYAELIGFTSVRKQAVFATHTSKTNTNKDVFPSVSSVLRALRAKYGKRTNEMGVPEGSYKHYEKGDRRPSREQLKTIIEQYPGDDELVHRLEVFANAEVFWDTVRTIEELPAQSVPVYDFEVGETHTFVAECAVIHNSQMIKRMTKVAPKARFVSGKGSSAAGLTASVVKDEFLRGYALEAGALVLANKGFAMIDELDKMSPEDRSAFHEALEQQTVTISKANIQATLRCETVVLAAANPKYGRFDPYEPLAKQIDLPSTLINRFDLIFPIKDMPNKGRDEQMAHFILTMHQTQGIVEVAYDTDTIKKFIAYARQHCVPTLSEDALEEIKKFYVDLRNSAKDSDMASIPISARQLEGLVRLSEASARSRLSPVIMRDDAKKAIELVYYCLSQIGMDPQTGKLDIDRASGNMPASERNVIHQVREIIKELVEATGQPLVPEEDIIAEAKNRSIQSQKAEDALQKLNQKGDIYQPRPGFYSIMK